MGGSVSPEICPNVVTGLALGASVLGAALGDTEGRELTLGEELGDALGAALTLGEPLGDVVGAAVGEAVGDSVTLAILPKEEVIGGRPPTRPRVGTGASDGLAVG